MIGRLRRPELPLFLILLVPGLLVLTLVVVLPLVLAVQYSTFEAHNFSGTGTFVGASNYLTLLGTAEFWQTLGRTVIYAAGSVTCQLVIGIIVALLLNTSFPGNAFLRGAAIVPYVLPVVVTTIAWQWILDPTTGILNQLLQALGIGPVNFLSARLAMATAIALSTWAWTPFVVIVFLAGLQTIPQDLYESARVDGASALSQFRHITVPMMREVIVTILVLRGIWMFSKFDLVYLLTGGGPLDHTRTLPVLIYDETFQRFNVGYGSAAAITSLIIMLAGLLLFLRLSRERTRPKRQVEVKVN